LQIAARDVQRDIGAVNSSSQNHQIIGDEVFAVVGDKDSVTEKFDIAVIPIKTFGDLGEIEDPLEMEGIVDVEMDPENGVGFQGIQGAIELEVIGICTFGGGFNPKRGFRVDVRGAQIDGEREEAAVLL
jgi:hypothetical protein